LVNWWDVLEREIRVKTNGEMGCVPFQCGFSGGAPENYRSWRLCKWEFEQIISVLLCKWLRLTRAQE